ncbi:hypothetical protein FQN52_003083 [Onygenales sp. PD_12]|nr:hypothetical protein FQN52_003083 [Onygenales sp. PD_12]
MNVDDTKTTTEQTPKGFDSSGWRLTPSMMDPNSFAFSTFADQPPAYYTSTPTGMGMAGHNQIPNQLPDLSTPGMPLNLLSPLSIPATTADVAAVQSAIDMNSLHHHPFAPHPASAVDAFVQPPSYAPSSFIHRDSAYDSLHGVDNSPINGMHPNNSTGLVHGAGLVNHMDNRPVPGAENFRFHVTLKAATAMIKDPEEIPITYLNKGQAYTVTILDTAPLTSGTQPLKYRTFIRVSFEDEEQRSKPAPCWQLWKEGRGSNEAHHRDGKLLAVEHVDPNQGGDGDIRHSQVQLESANFDGFSVLWTPNPNTGSPDCSISVRFNFLSTDFSHSKGVKGIPVRLCAKTEVVSTGNIDRPLDDRQEVCYCKVKLFRDHGAERKLANDVAHVKKQIEKLKSQLAQSGMGVGFDKRKRSGSMVSKNNKVLKHKRAWSGDSNGDGKQSAEEDLHMRMQTLKEMFSSTRHFSILNLKGEPQDDPDLYPVHLGLGDDGYPHTGSWETRNNADESSIASHNILSPATSNHSLSSSHHSFDHKQGAYHHQPQVYDGSRHDSMDWSSVSQQDSDSQPHIRHGRLLNEPVKVRKISADSPAYIEAMDVDATYQAPLAPPKKPTSCFYVQIRQPFGQISDQYYYAVYLGQRTAKDLVYAISKKCGIDSSRIVRAVCLRGNGLHVILEDEVVDQLHEGQDMVVEFSEPRDCSLEAGTDGDTSTPSTTSGLEIKLIF